MTAGVGSTKTGGEFARLAGVHVLIVEDNAHAAHVLAAVLEYCGAWATLASPARALTFLRSVTPHVLVIGTSAADREAPALLTTVRALAPGRGGGVPALALSADRNESARDAALAAGFQACLIKPVDVREFSRTIGRLVRR